MWHIGYAEKHCVTVEGVAMTESNQRAELSEEPQSERGPVGSRDVGGPPESGPANRPSGNPHSESTGVDKQGTKEDDMQDMPAGDQGG
ncbi:MAG: hypothetical protein QOF39_277 [Frankiales bacterium]|jgi:hypothetical protein|nr:hypothetical protein [Frankiales bacterium]